jgi:hypothetical protein
VDNAQILDLDYSNSAGTIKATVHSLKIKVNKCRRIHLYFFSAASSFVFLGILSVTQADEATGSFMLTAPIVSHYKLNNFNRMRINPTELKIGSGADNKIGSKQVESVKPGKIEIASIHDIEAPSFRDQFIKNT